MTCAPRRSTGPSGFTRKAAWGRCWPPTRKSWTGPWRSSGSGPTSCTTWRGGGSFARRPLPPGCSTPASCRSTAWGRTRTAPSTPCPSSRAGPSRRPSTPSTGMSPRDATPAGGALKFRGLLQQFIAVCNTMAYAHDQGVIHRDLKPSNIMLGPYGETLVMDWGLAKRLGTDDAGGEAEGDAPSPSPWPDDLTATGAVLGTPHYMSPEQARGEPAGPASDVFSLGLILYAILTGKSPYADAAASRGGPSESGARGRGRPAAPAGPGPARCAGGDLPQGPGGTARGPLFHPARPGRRLSRWLADEPVTAPGAEPLVERARRWVRRHRTAVAGRSWRPGGRRRSGWRPWRASRPGHKAKLEQANAAITKRKPRPTWRWQRRRRRRRRQRRHWQSRRRCAASWSRPLRIPDPCWRARPRRSGWPTSLDRAVGEARAEDRQGSKATRRTCWTPLGRHSTMAWASRRAVGTSMPRRAVREANLESDHPDTLDSRSNLASAYATAGRITEAIALLGRPQAAGDEARTRPPRHATTRNNLATSLLRRRPIRRGHHHPEATSSSARRSWAPTTPTRSPARHNLAAAYWIAGRIGEAIALLEATLKLGETKLGSDHPETLTSRTMLASAYNTAGRSDRRPSSCKRDPQAPRVEARARPPRNAQQPQQPGPRLPGRRPDVRGNHVPRGDPQARSEARTRPPPHAHKPQQPRREPTGRRPATPRRSRCSRRRSS